MKLLNLIRQKFCKHVMTPPEVKPVGDYYPSTIEHPAIGKVEMMKQDIVATSHCVKCGKKVCNKGYNSKPMLEDPAKEKKQREYFIRQMPYDEVLRVFIYPHLCTSHPNPDNYIKWLKTQPKEIAYNMAVRLEVK